MNALSVAHPPNYIKLKLNKIKYVLLIVTWKKSEASHSTYENKHPIGRKNNLDTFIKSHKFKIDSISLRAQQLPDFIFCSAEMEIHT